MAVTLLHWTPAEFWESTPHEMFAALNIWLDQQDPERVKNREFDKFKKDLEQAGVA